MQKGKNKIIHSPVFLAIFAIALVFFSVNIIKLGAKYMDTKNDRSDINKEMVKLENRTKIIQNKIDDLKTDAGFEDKVRERFNVGKEGENLAIIVDADKTNGQEASVVKTGFWQKIKTFFKPTEKEN